MKRTIEKKLYNTKTATLIADNDHRDGPRWYSGRRHELYRTKNGDYFEACYSMHVDEHDYIGEKNLFEAVNTYYNVYNQRVDFAAAFPGVSAEKGADGIYRIVEVPADYTGKINWVPES